MFGMRKNYEESESSAAERRLETEKKIIYGEDILYQKPPRVKKEQCKIFFDDADGGRGFGLTEDVLSKHLLLLGGTGSGKTNVINFMIDSLQRVMTDDDIMIIFDSKGDYKNRFFDADNDRHILIGHNAEYKNITKSWNIFDELKNEKGEFEEEESMLVAKEISAQLFKGRESQQQPFFALAAADIVSKVLIHKIREQKEEGKDIDLHTADFVRYTEKISAVGYYNMLRKYEDFRNAATYLGLDAAGKMLGGQGMSVLATINSMVNDIFTGPFSKDYGNGSISMRELVRKKGRKMVFIEYDLGVGMTLAPIYRLLIDLALKEAMGGRANRRGNTYLIIDEASLLVDLEHFQDALNFGRSLGVKVVAGLQSIMQFYDGYGKEKGKVIAAGFMNSICFQTWDLESRKFISERFGINYQNIAFRYDGNPIVIQREGNAIEDWDIMELGVGEAFVNLTQNGPVCFRFKFKKFD